MDLAAFAKMVSDVNRSFAVMARIEMDNRDSEGESFGVVVQIEKDCSKIADEMESLAKYAKTYGN